MKGLWQENKETCKQVGVEFKVNFLNADLSTVTDPLNNNFVLIFLSSKSSN